MGNLYFVNTLGAVLGALTASYFLSRELGTLGGFLALTGLLIFTASLAIVRRGSTLQKGLVLATLGGFAFSAYHFPLSLVDLRTDETLVRSNEDEYGVQVLTATHNHTMRVRNNRVQLIYDLGHPQTTFAQQMAAHLSVLLSRECSEVLNIGTGYGITAGTYTLYGDVHSIETIEILPFLVREQDSFSKYNFNYLTDPRVYLFQGDGRHYLVTSPKEYDIISVNVLDPYLPGSSSLYTVDFWRIARDHLRPGGVYTQLFWGVDLPLLAKALRTVFPSVLYFPAYGGTSFNVVAFEANVGAADALLRLNRLGPEAKEELWRLTQANPVPLFESMVKKAWSTRPAFDRLADGAPDQFHTDNFPILEYRWAHGVQQVSVFDSPLVEQ